MTTAACVPLADPDRDRSPAISQPATRLCAGPCRGPAESGWDARPHSATDHDDSGTNRRVVPVTLLSSSDDFEADASCAGYGCPVIIPAWLPSTPHLTPLRRTRITRGGRCSHGSRAVGEGTTAVSVSAVGATMQNVQQPVWRPSRTCLAAAGFTPSRKNPNLCSRCCDYFRRAVLRSTLRSCSPTSAAPPRWPARRRRDGLRLTAQPLLHRCDTDPSADTTQSSTNSLATR